MVSGIKIFFAVFLLSVIKLTVKRSLTLVPEAIYGGSEGEEKSPLVESVGNLTSMLSPSTEIEPR